MYVNDFDKTQKINYIEATLISFFHKSCFKLDRMVSLRKNLTGEINELIGNSDGDDLKDDNAIQASPVTDLAKKDFLEVLLKLSTIIHFYKNDLKEEMGIDVEKLTNTIFHNLTNDGIYQYCKNNNYVLSILFKFIDFVIEIGDFDKLSEVIPEIEKLYDISLEKCKVQEAFSMTL